MSNALAPEIEQATIKAATPDVHARHPLVHKGNHKKLLEYVQARLYYGKEARDSRVPRFAQIDRDVAGWMRLTEDDKERQREHAKEGTPQATAINLPLVFVQLDDMMSYYAETFAPNHGMFYHSAKPDLTKPAEQIVTLMNNHAIYASYYRHTMMTCFSCLKYNLGGFFVYWGEDYGPKIQQEGTGVISPDEQIWAGNKMESLDMYNTFWDPSVHPVELHKEGEWAARAFMRSHYWLASRASRGVYYNCEEALEGRGSPESVCKYYLNPPKEARLSADESVSSRGGTNWLATLSESSSYTLAAGYEIVEVFIRLNPNDFGLLPRRDSRRDYYEMWRITLLNDKYIIGADHMTNAHGQIPMYFGLANDDQMGPAAKSPAELLIPLQDFASTLLNVHVLMNRKNLFGTTIYDPTIVDLSERPEGEVAALIPIKASGYGKDLRNAIWRDTGLLDTKQTMGDLESVMGIINQFFPTQSMPSQIAGIDRAIDSQVAAVQQGTNRRQQKGAKLLDDSLFRPTRTCMYFNIIQYQKDGEQVNDFLGGEMTVNLSELRKTDIAFIIGQGIKAIDRMMIAGKVQQIIFALIQAPQAAQGMDILKMIDYWTSMLDIDVNFEQFRVAVAAQVDPLDPQQAGIQPATAPAAVMEPILA